MVDSSQRRRSIRLPGYDYTQAGAYFVTLVAYRRLELFGTRQEEKVHLNLFGEIAVYQWQQLEKHFPITLGEYFLMPDHLHGVLFLHGDNSSQDAPLPSPPRGTAVGSLGSIIQNYKSVTSMKINRARRTPGEPVWQRNYYEHIIRSDRSREFISAYIRENAIRHHRGRR